MINIDEIPKLLEFDGTSLDDVKLAKSIREGFLFRWIESGCKKTKDTLVVLGCTDPKLIIEHQELIDTDKAKAFTERIGATWIKPVISDDYKTVLLEPHRPPSRGGNSRAVHSHQIVIEGVKYYFTAVGTKHWVFSTDSVEFAWYYNKNGLRIILKGTIMTIDKKGEHKDRGDKSVKRKQRFA